jgi:hypothetical protein
MMLPNFSGGSRSSPDEGEELTEAAVFQYSAISRKTEFKYERLRFFGYFLEKHNFCTSSVHPFEYHTLTPV